MPSIYFCSDCDKEGTFADIASHRISNHPNESLIINQRVINQEGKLVRQEVNWRIIPSLPKQNCFIEINGHLNSLSIKHHDKFKFKIINSDKGTQTDTTDIVGTD